MNVHSRVSNELLPCSAKPTWLKTFASKCHTFAAIVGGSTPSGRSMSSQPENSSTRWRSWWRMMATECSTCTGRPRAASCTSCRFHARRNVQPMPLVMIRKHVWWSPCRSIMGAPYGPSMYACKYQKSSSAVFHFCTLYSDGVQNQRVTAPVSDCLCLTNGQHTLLVAATQHAPARQHAPWQGTFAMYVCSGNIVKPTAAAGLETCHQHLQTVVQNSLRTLTGLPRSASAATWFDHLPVPTKCSVTSLS